MALNDWSWELGAGSLVDGIVCFVSFRFLVVTGFSCVQSTEDRILRLGVEIDIWAQEFRLWLWLQSTRINSRIGFNCSHVLDRKNSHVGHKVNPKV